MTTGPHFSTRPAEPVAQGPELPSGLLALGYLVFVLAGVLTAVWEVLLVPTRIGGTLVPIAPVLAVLTNIALPAISFRLTETRRSAVPPVIGWIVTAIVLASNRPEGDVLLPGGSTAATSYAVLLGGMLAGVVTVASARQPGFLGRSWLGQRFNRPRAKSGSDSGGAR